jgi:hypothetical protein
VPREGLVVLSKEQEEIVRLLGDMPPQLVQEVLHFTLFLKERLAKQTGVDESYAWSEEDMRDVGVAALREADETFPGDVQGPRNG